MGVTFLSVRILISWLFYIFIYAASFESLPPVCVGIVHYISSPVYM